MTSEYLAGEAKTAAGIPEGAGAASERSCSFTARKRANTAKKIRKTK